MEKVNEKEEDKPKCSQRIFTETVREKGFDVGWAAMEKHLQEAEKFIVPMQELAKRHTEGLEQMNKHLLNAYSACPRKDALYGDSPIGPPAVLKMMQTYMRKLGSPLVNNVFENQIDIKEFKVQMDLACSWLRKFKPTK